MKAFLRSLKDDVRIYDAGACADANLTPYDPVCTLARSEVDEAPNSLSGDIAMHAQNDKQPLFYVRNLETKKSRPLMVNLAGNTEVGKADTSISCMAKLYLETFLEAIPQEAQYAN